MEIFLNILEFTVEFAPLLSIEIITGACVVMMFSNLLKFMDLTGPLTIDVPSLLSIPVKASHVMLEILLLFKFRILPLTEAARVEKNIVAPVAFV